MVDTSPRCAQTGATPLSEFLANQMVFSAVLYMRGLRQIAVMNTV